MNQLALSEPSTRLKPVTGDPKLKAVRGMCYLCRRLSSIASQVENQIREPSELALAGFQDVALRWHSAPRSDQIKLPPTAFRQAEGSRSHYSSPKVAPMWNTTQDHWWEIPNCNNRHASPLGGMKTCAQISLCWTATQMGETRTGQGGLLEKHERELFVGTLWKSAQSQESLCWVSGKQFCDQIRPTQSNQPQIISDKCCFGKRK